MGKTSNERLVEVRVTVPPQHLEILCDYVTDSLCTGLVLDDKDGTSDADVLFYSSPRDVTETLAALEGYLMHLLGPDTDPAGRVTTREIHNVVWEDEYRRSVRAVRIGPDIVVRPPWIQSEPGTKYDIVIEPKMAFGTGTHETTRTCLTLLRDHFRRGRRFLDLGCGSGILSIMADKLGASYIKAIDYDIVAVENSSENFESNQVAAPHEILFGSIEKCRDDQPYDFVCANIIKSAILDMLPELNKLVAKPGVLVLSGLLENDLDEVADSLNALNITRYDTIEDNEWRTILIQR